MGLALPAAAPAPQFLALVADEVTREAARQAAAQLGWPTAAVRAGGLQAAIRTLAQGASPAVLLVDVTGVDDVVVAFDALADVCEPGVRVVAIGAENDVGLYRRLVALGVADYLAKPVSADALAAALQPSSPARPARAGAGPGLRSVAVVGARGGAGATSVAAALGWALSQTHGRRTVLLDLDLQCGALALSLDIEPGRGLSEILAAPDRIDALLVGSAAAHAGDRLRVLAAEEPLDADVPVDAGGLEALVGALRDTSDALVMDVPHRLDRLGRAAIAAADVTVVVTDLSLPGLRDSRRLVALARSLRPNGEIVLVANRVGGVAGEAPRTEFEKALGEALEFVVPADPKTAAAAAEQGKTMIEVAAEGPAGKALQSLAERLSGARPVAAEPASWLQRLLRR
ncbi:CpaE family protein [Phenylobacterium sp.]|jgi:pilus assembly protein CpaE|uniref:CpaE family protein n=1 Tax=Phenylobacterium sp. TaxID=1871053 RepID=UPI003784123C